MEKEKDITEIIQSWYEAPLSEEELNEAVERFFKFFQILYAIEQKKSSDKE